MLLITTRSQQSRHTSPEEVKHAHNQTDEYLHSHDDTSKIHTRTRTHTPRRGCFTDIPRPNLDVRRTHKTPTHMHLAKQYTANILYTDLDED